MHSYSTATMLLHDGKGEDNANRSCPRRELMADPISRSYCAIGSRLSCSIAEGLMIKGSQERPLLRKGEGTHLMQNHTILLHTGKPLLLRVLFRSTENRQRHLQRNQQRESEVQSRMDDSIPWSTFSTTHFAQDMSTTRNVHGRKGTLFLSSEKIIQPPHDACESHSQRERERETAPK